jgi:hypothetical protein
MRITTYRKQIEEAIARGWEEFRTPAGWKKFSELLEEAKGMDPDPLDEPIELPDHLEGFDGRFTRAVVFGDQLLPVRTRKIRRYRQEAERVASS